MATIPSWQDEPSIWDRLRLGEDYLPGPVRVSVQRVDSGLDVRKAPKTNRAALVDQGYNPIRGSISFPIGFSPIDDSWASPSEQFKKWLSILDKIRPKRAQKRTALSIVHPQFQLVGVTSVYVTSVSGLEGEGPGIRTVTIEVVEKAPITSASTGTVGTTKPKGSTSLSSLSNASNPAATETGP